MRKIMIMLGFGVVSLLANEHEIAKATIANSDFIARTVNFVIFAGILWYLLADKVKDFYSGRSEKIADSFAEIEEKLNESLKEKEALKQKVEEAHKEAEEIINTAKKETEIIKKNIINTANQEVDMLKKQFSDYKTYEESKMKQEVVGKYLNELVEDIHLSSEEVANIVTKKVG